MRKVLLFLLAFVSIPPAAAACTCFRPATCEVLWTAAAVFAGRVLDIRPAVQPGLTGAKAVRFAVEHQAAASAVRRSSCWRFQKPA
jgi:hypothetical protein